MILVNGVPWPKMKVKPRKYRFRILECVGLPVLRRAQLAPATR